MFFRKQNGLWLLVLCLMACQAAPAATPIAESSVTADSSTMVTAVPTASATPIPTRTATLPVSGTASASTPSATVRLPTRPPMPTPPPPAFTTEDEAVSYSNEAGRFSLQLPPHTAVYENLQPSVDGVFVEVPQSFSLIRESPNYAISVEWTAVDETMTLPDFVNEQSTCFDVNGAGGKQVIISDVDALLFDETLCGVFYTAYLYLLHDATGYTITVRSFKPYSEIATFVQEQLDSFTITA